MLRNSEFALVGIKRWGGRGEREGFPATFKRTLACVVVRYFLRIHEGGNLPGSK